MPVFTPFVDGERGNADTFNLRFEEMATAIAGGGDAGVWARLINWTTLNSSPSQINLDVPIGYTQLVMTAMLRGDVAAVNADLRVTVNNNVSASNYYLRGITYTGTTTINEQLGSGANGWQFPSGLVGASGAAGQYSILELTIIDYLSNSEAKSMLFRCSSVDGSGLAQYAHGGGTFLPTGPITSLQIVAGSGNFAVGSKYGLHGVL